MPDAAPPSTPAWGYRPHLDGLRTVAVYLVVLYHAGLVAFEGGFIGVDLFFVLSGYLVTSVLLAELVERDSIDLIRFYARRVRRLLPAAAVLVVGVAVAAVLVTSSVERASMVGDARAASLWFANWHFVGELNDYFAVDGPESPFIHFWSLAIEEQFYLVFPLLVVGVWKLRPDVRVLATVTATVALASVVLQVVLAQDNVNRAYLGTDTRVYQILIGSLLAMALLRRRSRSAAPSPAVATVAPVVAPIALIALVVAATSWFDVTASNRGFVAAAISVAVITLLEVTDGGPFARLLGVRPIRYLGQISYGTYLWHWPVMVLAKVVLDMSPAATAVIGGVVGTALAALSADLIERPIRSAPALDRVPRTAIAGGVACAAAVGLVIAPIILDSDRKPVVLARGEAAPAVGAITGPVPDLDWVAIEQSNPDVPTCELDDASDCYIAEGSGPTVLLVGDSHARMLIPMFEQLAAERDLSVALAFAPSCPWQRGLLAGDGDGDRFTEGCRLHQPRTHETLLPAVDPDVIVVAGFPRSTSRGTGFSDRSELADLSTDELVAGLTTEAIETFATQAPVIVVEPVPILPRSQVACLSAVSELSECAYPPDAQGIEESVERRLAGALDRVITIDLDPHVCPAVSVCDPIIDGLVVRRDAHHLTPDFARTLVPVFDAALDAIGS